MTPLLQLKGVSIGFPPAAPVVKSVDLYVEASSFTSLVGESGSGKTVTAMSVCRLLDGTLFQGSVLWDGLDLAKASEKELRAVRGRHIAYVFQDPSSALDPLMRVGEQIAEARAAHFPHERGLKNKVLEYLNFVSLQDPERVYGSYPHELSGGMKQRAVIAMALISEPRLLIADEPTTAIDASVQAGILALLQKIQNEKHLSILFITHDLDLAAAYSDTMYVMEKGRIVEKMQPDAGFFSPKEAYTKKLFDRQLGRQKPKTLIGQHAS